MPVVEVSGVETIEEQIARGCHRDDGIIHGPGDVNMVSIGTCHDGTRSGDPVDKGVAVLEDLGEKELGRV